MLHGHHYAAEALRFVGKLSEETIAALALQLESEDLIHAAESAAVIINENYQSHPSVIEVIAESPSAVKTFHWVENAARKRKNR